MTRPLNTDKACGDYYYEHKKARILTGLFYAQYSLCFGQAVTLAFTPHIAEKQGLR
jgi:hypothetical protein